VQSCAARNSIVSWTCGWLPSSSAKIRRKRSCWTCVYRDSAATRVSAEGRERGRGLASTTCDERRVLTEYLLHYKTARPSLGVPGLLHDVAERPLRRASATHLWGCRARRRCYFDASSRGAGRLMQHLLRGHGRISGTLTCVDAQDVCYARFAPREKRRHRFFGQLTPAQADSQPSEPINLADQNPPGAGPWGLTREY
jgi:hypothetical protein